MSRRTFPVNTAWGAAIWPSAAFLSVAAGLAITDADPFIARLWAYTPTQGWLAASDASFASTWLHAGGRFLVIGIAVVAAAASLWGRRFPQSAPGRWTRELMAISLSIGLTALVVGALKQVTNVDCPSDLIGLGGAREYFGVFRLRPAGLPHAVCFPGAHAASGFSLFGAYFALRDRSRRGARIALFASLALGVAFAWAQEARGAHFLSHDLWSAWIAWMTGLLVCRRVLGPRRAAEQRSLKTVLGAHPT